MGCQNCSKSINNPLVPGMSPVRPATLRRNHNLMALRSRDSNPWACCIVEFADGEHRKLRASEKKTGNLTTAPEWRRCGGAIYINDSTDPWDIPR
jgi:hypothetical protein